MNQRLVLNFGMLNKRVEHMYQLPLGSPRVTAISYALKWLPIVKNTKNVQDNQDKQNV